LSPLEKPGKLSLPGSFNSFVSSLHRRPASHSRASCCLDYTVKENLEPYILELFPQPHTIPALACIRYLSLGGFQDKQPGDEDDIRQSFEEDPLLNYASDRWDHHAHLSSHDEGASAAIADFVLACRGYPARTDEYDGFDFLGPLQVAAFYGFDELIHLAAQVQHPNAQTPCYERSALMFACMKGNHACAAKLLSLPSTDVNLRDELGATAVILASKAGDTETVKVLLAVSGIDIDIADEGGVAALHWACERGSIDTMGGQNWVLKAASDLACDNAFAPFEMIKAMQKRHSQ
jgi:Ankyrin repeats (3 copies)